MPGLKERAKTLVELVDGAAFLFAERPLVIVGKYHGEPGGEIVVSGYTGRGRFEQRIKVVAGQPDPANDGLKYLWARERVRLLSDFRVVDDGEAGRLALTEQACADRERQLEHLAATHREVLASVAASASWRITAPMRAIARHVLHRPHGVLP